MAKRRANSGHAVAAQDPQGQAAGVLVAHWGDRAHSGRARGRAGACKGRTRPAGSNPALPGPAALTPRRRLRPASAPGPSPPRRAPPSPVPLRAAIPVPVPHSSGHAAVSRQSREPRPALRAHGSGHAHHVVQTTPSPGTRARSRPRPLFHSNRLNGPNAPLTELGGKPTKFIFICILHNSWSISPGESRSS